ncbi:MAG: protein kinase domain-containing protein, partial [Solimonas sp.]
TRLDRPVAIKVLPSHLAQDPELRQRFEREARAVSSLNHPHICTLYDIGRHESTDYLVMEYLEGETLAARLEKGALPMAQALRWAIEISEALDQAHRQGVVHRDLKPGNIMLTKGGAKLLDFGLAKSITGTVADPRTVSQATPLTAAGSLVGTFQYMSPEQLEGKEADARSDIFAFGAVLYEMVTGRKAFQANSQASLIAAILEREPAPLSEMQPLASPALERLVKTCLSKDPDERWQTARDLLRELRWLAGQRSPSSSVTALPAAPLRRGLRREHVAWGLALLLAVTLAAAIVRQWSHTIQPEAPVTRFTMHLPPKANFPRQGGLALSPDGRRLAFVASTDGKAMLWLHALDSFSPQP